MGSGGTLHGQVIAHFKREESRASELAHRRLLALPLLALLPSTLDFEPDEGEVPVPSKDDVANVLA